CAEAFAAAGAELLVLDRDAEGAKRVADAVGGQPLVADLDDPTVVANLPLDRVDVVINNAGFQHVAGVPEFAPAAFSSRRRALVATPSALARAVLPNMQRRRWGRLVDISSPPALRGSACKAGYVTAQRAVEGLSKGLAVEGAPHGITSTTICPG